MTPRERVLTALHHEPPDFTPCDYFATPEIHDALCRHFGVTEDHQIRTCLGCDLRYIRAPYTGPPLPEFDDRSTQNIWGVRRRPMPNEYGEYMDLFNGMVDAILNCKKPTICRVNGMRIAGGQEIGMACDVTVASDLAMIGQAGPRHGSAPDGGSTDFLPWFLSMEDAMWNCISCELWSAYKMKMKGLISKCVTVLKIDGQWVRNPLVVTDRYLEDGEIVYGEFKTGAEGKLFGSIGTLDIAEAATEAGVPIERSEVRLPEGAFRQLGEYTIQLHLHTDVNTELTLVIDPE